MALPLRRARWLVALVVVLLVAAAAASFLLLRPGLEDAQDGADARWAPLRAPLVARYEVLAEIAAAFHDAGAGNRAVTEALDVELAAWGRLSSRDDARADVVAETTAANALEALARRARVNFTNSARLALNPTIAAAFTAYDQAIPVLTDVDAYNRAVKQYEDERSGFPARLVAGVLGFAGRAELAFGP